jgi:hypothetical protein
MTTLLPTTLQRLESLVERVEAYAVAGPELREFLETYDMITLGSSLSRIWQYTQRKNISFGVVSGFLTKGVEQIDIELGMANNLEIARKARVAGFGYIWLKGHWWDQEREIQVQEDSLLIYGKPGQAKALKDFLLEIIQTYKQEAFGFKPEGSDHLYGIYRDGKKEDYGVFHPDRLGDCYSQLKRGKHAGRTFVFASVWGLQTPSNHRAIVARLKAGVQDHPDRPQKILDIGSL